MPIYNDDPTTMSFEFEITDRNGYVTKRSATCHIREIRQGVSPEEATMRLSVTIDFVLGLSRRRGMYPEGKIKVKAERWSNYEGCRKRTELELDYITTLSFLMKHIPGFKDRYRNREREDL